MGELTSMHQNKCRNCGIELTDETWLPSSKKVHAHICKFCERKRSQLKYIKNQEYINQKHKERYQQKRNIVLNHYSNGSITCKCCGEPQIEFLSIDHINNDGSTHRKEIGSNLYNWLINNNFPEGFQVLCFNCNFAKGIYGFCPHKRREHD